MRRSGSEMAKRATCLSLRLPDERQPSGITADNSGHPREQARNPDCAGRTSVTRCASGWRQVDAPDQARDCLR